MSDSDSHLKELGHDLGKPVLVCRVATPWGVDELAQGDSARGGESLSFGHGYVCVNVYET